MADAPTANEIKTQLKTLLTPVIGTSGTKKTLILDYLALAIKPGEGEDVTPLRSPIDTATLADGTPIKRVNCLMISEEAFSQSAQVKDAIRSETRPQGKNIITRRFRLTLFYQYGKIATSDTAQPSETVASEIIELVRAKINDSPKLGFSVTDITAGVSIAGKGQYIDGHDKLQMTFFEPEAFGDVICHVAGTLLTVRTIEPLGT